MDKTKVTSKSVGVASIQMEDDITNDLELINLHTISPLCESDVYCFKVILCDNDIDRAYEKMTDTFLEQFAAISKSLTGLKDHDWGSDNQLSRLYDTEVVVDDSQLTKLGEPRKYVLGKAYTLSKFKDYIEKINAGLLKEVSVSFKSVGDTCSICGGKTMKDKLGIAYCENGHKGGETYEGKVFYSILGQLEESYEWSLVAVPCQKNSGIKNKNIENGGMGIMKKSMFMLQRLINSKAFKNADAETQEVMQKAVDATEDADLSEEDIKSLIAENAKLKEKVATLEDKVKEAEGGRTKDKVAGIVGKAVDGMNPLTPTVKENILRDMDLDSMSLDGENVKGLDEALKSIQEKYKGLIAEIEEAKEEAEEKETDSKEVDEKDLDEKEVDEKEEDDIEVNKKSTRVNSGISFGIGANNKNVKAAKSGLVIK